MENEKKVIRPNSQEQNYNHAKILNRISFYANLIATICFIISFILSNADSASNTYIVWTLTALNFSIFFLTSIIILLDLFYSNLFFKAETVRIKGFLSSSYNEFSISTFSKNYYSYKELPPGNERMLMNLWECCFYTNRQAKIEYRYSTCILVIVTIFMLPITITNSINIELVNICLSLFFSRLFYIKYLNLKNIYNKTSDILDAFDNCNDFAAMSTTDQIGRLIAYQLTLSTGQIILRESIYNKHKNHIEDEWNSLLAVRKKLNPNHSTT